MPGPSTGIRCATSEELPRHGPYTADFCGAALWLPPGAEPSGEAIAKLFRDTADREHLDDLLATFERMEQSHPRESH